MSMVCGTELAIESELRQHHRLCEHNLREWSRERRKVCERREREKIRKLRVGDTPVLHAIGFPALGKLQSTNSRFATGGDVIICGVTIKIPTETTHFVLQPWSHGDAERVKAVVPNLDVLGRVNNQKTFRCGYSGHQTCYERHRNGCSIYLWREKDRKAWRQGDKVRQWA